MLKSIMKFILEINLYRIFAQVFFDPIKFIYRILSLPIYIENSLVYFWQTKKRGNDKFPLKLSLIYPCLDDRFMKAGRASGIYFFQDLWAAKLIYKKRPDHHLDIGSRIDGFISHLLTFLPVVKYVDLRELKSNIEGLQFIQGNICNLTNIKGDSISSLSSLCVIEHIGLGRYGDSIDPNGYLKACDELKRILARGGDLYVSVPIGKQRVCFDAHRVLNPEMVLELFGGLRLVKFSCINDEGEFIELANLGEYKNSRFSCGLYHFTKD